ncbi:MAG TPA: hypothetical protein VK154_10550 [Chitinophagales bacterium]|nr:hypothetical protein [Chitinophagales bacterium]
MDKSRRHTKVKLSGKLTDTNLYTKSKAGGKDEEILKPGTKIKLAWQVTYKKK